MEMRMRTAMGDVYCHDGYFHIESLLNPGLAPWTREEADAYAVLLKGLVVLTEIELVFWIFHPRGFGLILRKAPDIAYGTNAKFEALHQIGESKFADRWAAQADESAKPLSRHHAGKRDYYRSLRQDLGSFTKTLKQRVSAAYNNDKQFVGPIWRDRAKVFHLPDDPADLSEVAAFILVQAELQNGADCLDFPGTVRDVLAGEDGAGRALQAIFQNRASAPRQLERLLKLRSDLLEEASTTIKGPGRGRPAAWRPQCERG